MAQQLPPEVDWDLICFLKLIEKLALSGIMSFIHVLRDRALPLPRISIVCAASAADPQLLLSDFASPTTHLYNSRIWRCYNLEMMPTFAAAAATGGGQGGLDYFLSSI